MVECTGKGVFVSKTGNQYEGEWTHNLRQGTGTQLDTNDGSIYHGDFVQGLKHGKGSITYLNGDRYEGRFVLDHSRGVGSYMLHVRGEKGSNNGSSGGGGTEEEEEDHVDEDQPRVVKLRVYGY